uniref:Transmembrane protein n=1 Tax=Globisporangium ultimum (strain ATCC 200006 / CBS 805.95 / DAOM BR144) TaxID=431595 RepID=K3W5A6_GLOUD
MIIRAVSSDEDDNDDNEQQQAGSSVFGSGGTDSVGREGSLHSAKLVWIAATLALVVLVLVDIAGIMNQFQQQQSIAPATSVNSIVGSLIVAGWIYSREQSKNVRRYRVKQRRSGGSSGLNASSWTAGYSWLPIAGLVCFGHVVTCMYILMALFESNGDRRVFFLGKSSNSRTYPSI